MLASSPSHSKRARFHRVWHRLHDHKQAHVAILMREKPSPVIMKNIIDKHSVDLNLDGPEFKKIENWIDGLFKNNIAAIRVAYTQTEYASAAPSDYNGSTMIGRMFSKWYTSRSTPVYRSQQLKRVARNTLYKDSHFEIDMVNCHPTIACWLFDHLHLQALKEYVEDRESVQRDLIEMSAAIASSSETPGAVLDASIIKRVVNAIINNAGSTYGLRGSDIKYIKVLDRIAFFSRLKDERALMIQEMKRIYPGFVKMVTESARSNNKDGKAMSILLQDVENEILMKIYDKINETSKGDVKDVVFLFDGVLIPKSLIPNIDSFIVSCQSRIQDQIGIVMHLCVKDMEPYFDDCEDPSSITEDPMEEDKDYSKWKVEFEKTHYRIKNPTCYAEICKSGTTYHNLSRFKTDVCVEEDEEFVKMWCKDKDKRKYEKEDFSPPPHKIPDDYLNTFTGLAAEELDPVDDADVDDLIKPLLYHIKILGGMIPANENYIIKWLAMRVQKPGVLPMVGLGFRSVEGTGKDSFFSFFGNKVVGTKYYTQSPEMASLFADKHSMALKDKLLVVISECTRSDSNSVRNRMKSFMTSPTIKIRPLYVEEMIRYNFCGVVMFGQDQQFLNIEGDDRRFMVMDVLPIHANDPSYFGKFIPVLEDPNVARAFYQYLMGVDISSFNASSDRPMTMARMNMMDFSCKVFFIFLKEFVDIETSRANVFNSLVEHLGFTIKRTTMFESYQQFVDSNYPKYASDLRQKRKFMSEVRTLHNDSIKKNEAGELVHAFKMCKIDGYDMVKIKTKEIKEFLKKYLPSDD